MSVLDRALRHQVARLQELTEEDRAAILTLLEPTERETVLTLIDDGVVDASSSPPPAAPANRLVLPPDLAPWLRAKLVESESGIEGLSVTAHCLDALRACVAEQVPQPAPSERSLLGLVRDRFRWRALGRTTRS